METKKTFFKTILAVLMTVLCLSTSIAQQHKMKDGCIMKGGKMIHVMDGKMMPMETQMTMGNGIMLMPNGEFIGRNGVKMILREGEMMDMKGNVMNTKMKKTVHKKTTSKKYTRVVKRKTTN